MAGSENTTALPFAGEPVLPVTHANALDAVRRRVLETFPTLEEVIAIYLRASGILADDAPVLSARIPEDWTPPTAARVAELERQLQSRIQLYRQERDRADELQRILDAEVA